SGSTRTSASATSYCVAGFLVNAGGTGLVDGVPCRYVSCTLAVLHTARRMTRSIRGYCEEFDGSCRISTASDSTRTPPTFDIPDDTDTLRSPLDAETLNPLVPSLPMSERIRAHSRSLTWPGNPAAVIVICVSPMPKRAAGASAAPTQVAG